MKKQVIDNKEYWVDYKNNKWSCDKYTEEQAEELSKTLVGCYNCTDCKNSVCCKECTNCKGCLFCFYCTNCTGCAECTLCHNGIGLSYTKGDA